LAREPPPEGKVEEDNNSTPVAFDVHDGKGGKVGFNNGECKGKGNSNGPIDNKNDDNYNIGNKTTMTTMGGGGQDRSTNVR
jgi:hypothetical protein